MRLQRVRLSLLVPLFILAGAGVAQTMLALEGCAPKTHHVATVSVVSAHAVLSAIQDTERAAVCGAPTAPTPCIPQATHQQIASKLVTAFDLDGRIATAVRDLPVDQPLPTTVTDWITQITQIVQQVLALIPDGPFKTALVAKLGGA